MLVHFQMWLQSPESLLLQILSIPFRLFWHHKFLKNVVINRWWFSYFRFWSFLRCQVKDIWTHPNVISKYINTSKYQDFVLPNKTQVHATNKITMPLIAGKDTKSASSCHEWQLLLTKELNRKETSQDKEKCNEAPDRWVEMRMFDMTVDPTSAPRWALVP